MGRGQKGISNNEKTREGGKVGNILIKSYSHPEGGMGQGQVRITLLWGVSRGLQNGVMATEDSFR